MLDKDLDRWNEYRRQRKVAQDKYFDIVYKGRIVKLWI